MKRDKKSKIFYPTRPPKRGRTKGGQVTIFIIVGIFTILGSLMLFILKDALNINEDETLKLNTAAGRLGSEVGECLDETLEEGLYVVALHGGYSFLPPEYIGFEEIIVPYYFFENEKTVLTEEELEVELEFYIMNNIVGCVYFDYYLDRGISIELDSINPEVMLEDERVLVEMDFPITISDGNLTSVLDEQYQTGINNRIKYLRNISEGIIDSYMEGEYFIDVEFIFSHDVNATTYLHPDGDLIYFLRDEKFVNPELPFVYSFAIDIK